MQINRENLAGNKVKLTVALDQTEWEAVLDRTTQELSSNIKIEGFRDGKAPRAVVVTKLGEGRVISAAIEMAVEQYYPKAAQQEELKPIAFPSIAVEKGTLETPLEFSAEVAVLPEVSLGDYSKIRVKKEVPEVTDAMIEDALEGLRKKTAEYTEVDREVQQGDWTEIDFTGSVDGVEFPGGQSKNHPLVIGDKMFIPGFEEGIVGMKKGEEKTIEVTFPTDYHSAELAGKKAQFAVKLNLVKVVSYPELSDDFAKKVSQFATIDELRADVRRFMTEDAQTKAEEKAREEAILELIKVTRVDLPEELVTQELTAMINDLKHQVTHGQMSFEDYLSRANTDEEGLRGKWRAQAVERVMAGLALDAFGKAENISVSHDDVHAEIDRLKELHPDQAEEIEQHYGNHNHGNLESQMRTRKIVDRLMEIAGS